MRGLIFAQLLWLCLALTARADASAIRNPTSRMDTAFSCGISARIFQNVNRNDAAAALKAWGATVGRESNLDQEIEVTLYDRFEELRDAFFEKRVHAVALSVEELMQLGSEPEEVILLARQEGVYHRYAILAHRTAGLVTAADMGGRKLVTYDSEATLMAQPWLERLIIDHTPTGAERRFPVTTLVGNASKAIMQVFFRQAGAALVPLDAFHLACDLNPQLTRELVVVAESPPFIGYFFLFRPDIEPRDKQLLESAILNLHQTEGGRQVLTVFKSLRMEKHPITVLNPTRAFLTEHHHLVKGASPQRAHP